MITSLNFVILKIQRAFNKSFLYVLLITFYLLFSYNYFGRWYDSSLGTISILIISFFIWKKEFLSVCGLKWKIPTLGKTLLLMLLLLGVNMFLISYIAEKNEVSLTYSNWRSFYHIFFYTLNEEIIMGALPLLALLRRSRKHAIYGVVIIAFLFSIIHFVFYKWVFDDRGNIAFITLTTLFFIGLVRNQLIIQTGHIGYSWALHFSWVAIMFGYWHHHTGTTTSLGERTRFNLYLGSYEMLILSISLALLMTVFLVKSKQKSPA